MPENEEIIKYIKRAFELREQECYKQAIEMLYKAIVIEPDNIEILYQIGELYYLLGNYTRAIQYPEQILKLDNNHIPSLKLMMNIYTKQDELYTAKEYAEKIYAIETNEQNLVSLINLYGKLSLFEEIDKYKNLIEQSENCITAYAKICYSAHKIDVAEEVIKKGLEINPDNEELKILTGKIYFDKNEFEKAKEIFASFNNNTYNPEILNYKGLFAMDEQDFISAIKNFSKALNLDSKNANYAYNLGNAYHLNGWYDEAVETYKKAIFLQNENTDFRYSLAYAYFANKDYEKAKFEIDFVLEHNPKHLEAKVLKALILFKEKNYTEAEKILKSNISEDKNNEFTLSALSKVEAELGKYDKAEEHLSILIKNNPENLNYKSDLSDVYVELKDYNSALKIANEIIQENPNYVEGYLIGAKASYKAENYDEAKRFAQEVLSIDINCAKGYYYLAMVRKQEQDYPEAIECMRRAIIYDVGNAEFYAKMAEIYELEGDNKSAFEYIKEAENINPSEEYKILYKKFASLNRK